MNNSIQHSEALIKSLIATAIGLNDDFNDDVKHQDFNEAEASLEKTVDTMIYQSSCGFADSILFNSEAVANPNIIIVGKDMAKAIKNGATVGRKDFRMVVTILKQASEMAYAISPDGLSNGDSIYHIDLD